MGDMQGKPMSEWHGPLPENVEPAANFAGRADKWWKGVIVRYVNSVGQRRGREMLAVGEAERPELDPADILVVSHGGLIRTLVQSLIGSRKVVCAEGVEVDQSRLKCPNASVTVIEVDKAGKGRLVLWADTTHLDVELVENNVDVVEDGDEQ
ncbi:hypothetical protein NM688_g8680 [Phlebia brevispora]|uniref:Uncharacterized protein n=1 Tax=Phlebia brevispora TaxID=194682 RepID=A0ACC1RQ91_9APHY|nr:hypothetical protein NM688_g8680 [Phlebia brevispora]